jgi:hypothetical protein
MRDWNVVILLLAVVATLATSGSNAGVHLVAALALALTCFRMMTRSRERWPRVAWFNAGAIVVIVALAETYASWTDTSAEGPNARLELTNESPRYIPDDVLGYRLAPNYSTSMRFYFDDELVYDVRHTTDAFGLRIEPPTAVSDEERCLLFFGCSYAYGAGVDDTEAMPYVVGMRTGGRYRIRNFAVGGYGPNQMLAAIESGLVERAAACDATHAIYVAIPHHLMRVSGHWHTEEPGPRYALQNDGSVIRQGRFVVSDGSGWLEWLLDRSPLWDRLFGTASAANEVKTGDITLLHRVVERSRDLLRQRYPGIEFHVLYWDVGDPGLFGTEFVSSGIPVHRLSALLPSDPGELEASFQIPHDGHPNVRAHARIADYVVQEILSARRPRP